MLNTLHKSFEGDIFKMRIHYYIFLKGLKFFHLHALNTFFLYFLNRIFRNQIYIQILINRANDFPKEQTCVTLSRFKSNISDCKLLAATNYVYSTMIKRSLRTYKVPLKSGNHNSKCVSFVTNNYVHKDLINKKKKKKKKNSNNNNKYKGN